MFKIEFVYKITVVEIIALVEEREDIEDNNQTEDTDLCYDIKRVINISQNENGYQVIKNILGKTIHQLPKLIYFIYLIK